MSWNIQRPEGVGAMAPLEGQAYMSHEQLLTNRDALERKLSQRRPRQELVNRGIMPAVSAAPGILTQRTKLERAKTGDILQRKIRTRPNRAQLIQRHILKESTPAVDPSLIDKQMRLKRKKLEDNLNDKLLFRPGPLELVKENILEAGTAMSQAVQEGTVPFTETTDCLDALSPESINDSPEASPSPEPSQVVSPQSVASSPGSTCIMSTVQALASLQAQTQKHSQQQQEKQQQQHQMFLQQQNNQLLTTPSPLSASLQGTKKEGKSRKKTAKPKVKKYKYHEYRPPNGEVQKSDLPSDSPYGLLLQQQQLYLQLQVLFQNYPQHCMLPSIPENVKLGANGSKNSSGGDSEKTVKIEDMRVVDMRRALKERGLPVFGSKTDLIKRLKEAEPLMTSAVSSSSTIPAVVSTQGQITTSAPSMSQVQALPKQAGHPAIHRSHSMPLQNGNLNTVEQLKMQILANNQSLQQLTVPPEVQQQLQQLQYLNLQLQLKHLNIQQQQNIQPKPQETSASSTQTAAVKKESLIDSHCSFSQPAEQQQAKDQKPSFALLQQQSQQMQMSPGRHSPQLPQQQQLQQVDHLDQGLVHLQEQAQTLDLSSPHIDSNPGSVESQILSWDQQHPLFDGDSESYPSPGSQQSDLSSFSPLQVDHLSHSMEALHNTNVFQGNTKPDSHHMQRSYSERTPDGPDDFFLMVPQTKPRSLSEPQFPVSMHKRSSSFPSVPFSTPPPSYEAHMAAQSQKQHRNIALGGQIGGGFAVTNDISPKHEDMDLPLESVIQDKELSQELHKAMMKNFNSLDHDEILEILGEPRTQLPTTSSTYAGVVSSSQVPPVSSQTVMSKSPSFGYLRTSPVHTGNSPGRMSRSCEDVSHLPVGNKFPVQMDNYNTLSDFDHMLMSPLSPMKVDSCDTDDHSGLLYHTSNSIPIPSSNGGVERTDNLSWLDLSMSPSAQNTSSHGSIELSHNNNINKGTPPTFLYDPATTFKGDETFPLSLFDLETPTALHPPSDFSEAMDYCV